MSGYNSIIAALLFIVLLLAFARTRIGYALLYYFVLASIVLVWLVGSPKVATIFKGG